MAVYRHATALRLHYSRVDIKHLSHAPSHVRSQGPGSNLTQVLKQEVGVYPAPDIEFMFDSTSGPVSSSTHVSKNSLLFGALIYLSVCVLRDRMSGPEMVPADLEQLWGVIQQQTVEIMSLKQEMVGLRAEVTALRAETAGLRAECGAFQSDLTTLQADYDDLAAAQIAPAEPVRPAQSPKISLPDKWDGSGARCEVFLTNLSLIFEFQPSRYPTDRSRIALLISLLTGQAAEWATAVLKANGDSAHSYPAFTAQLKAAFQHPESEVEVDSRLYHLKQGERSVSRYTTEFRTLSVQTTWSDAALRTAYYEGLSIRLKDELAVRELPETLEGMIQLALRVDQRMRHSSHRTNPVFRSSTGTTPCTRALDSPVTYAVAAPSPPPPIASKAHSSGAGEPMQIGRTSLSAAERARRYREVYAPIAPPQNTIERSALFVRETARPGREGENLTVIRQTKQLNPRQARWALFFEHFNFQLSYRPGSKNSKADAISRQHQRDSTTSEAAPVLPSHVILAPLRWGLEERVRQSHSQNPPPPDTPTGRLFVPDTLRQEVLQWGHDSTLAGHPGVQRTINFITRAFWWRTLRRDVQQYVQACNICARSKTNNTPSTGELQPLPIPKRPWSHISINFVTGLPESQGKNTILTIVDRFSKAVHLVALTGLPSATAELILEHVVRLHGFPKDIVSDRGPQFTAKFWQAFCRLIGTTSSLSSGFHPQTNGQTKRANQQLERFLRCFAGEHQCSWARYLVWAELSNNIHTSSATNLSPFEVCYGFQPPVFEHQEPEVEVPSAQQLVRRCRRLWSHARTAIQKANTRYTTQHCHRHPPGRLFHVGDRVYLSTRNINLKTDSRKLTARFIGPFKITHRLNPVTFRLLLPKSLRIHPVFHQSQLKHVFFSPLSPQVPAPPPPWIIDGGPAYTVRRILDSCPRGRGTQYLVDWEGYGPEERSWVPGRFILDPALIQDYRRRVSSAPGPSGAGPGGGGTVTRTESHEVTRTRK
ncbi:Transposon Tf2-9 polyprotein [Labeo rohita]|uniref:Gypsy retrotransposon integrase-like protein 1 n=1 Tax=Labeo rohita TaxID=84645 RepID=A0ABQ8LSB8_LABRO|nr:Transposon Tf2-9 polyprotein [Labeo rohita]